MGKSFTRQICCFLLLICFVGCKKNLSYEESQSKFLNSEPQSKEFALGLQGVANHLYNKKWPGKYHFTKPKIRHEKMLVEWELKTKQKTIRKETLIRCTSNVERLGLSCLISELGPINLNKLMKSSDYRAFIESLKAYLAENAKNENLFQTTLTLKENILQKFGVSTTLAKENETNYKCGIIITTGFYMGFPFYKRITLDSQIENREEYLSTYLHECGHQLFDFDRKFLKTLKLGFSWIGWIKSTHSWWVVEEKSCNLFAEEILKNYKADFKSNPKFNESLATSQWKFLPLASDYKERYSRLFFNPVSVLAQLKNSRVDSRYSTKDEIATVFRAKLSELGVKEYIKSINKYITLKDVLKEFKASQLEDVSKK